VWENVYYAGNTSRSRRYLVHMARLAEETRTELLCVQGELASATAHEPNRPRWHALAQRLRQESAARSQ